MIPLDKRAKWSAVISQCLAEGIDLQMQLKQACWNVKRTQSTSLHELFEEIAKEVACFTDMVAERIVQLGGIARGTVRTAAVRSRLEEYPLVVGSKNHVEAVARALSDFGRQARTAVEEASMLGDTDTADLFAEICRGIDKWLRYVQNRSKTSPDQPHKQELAPINIFRLGLTDNQFMKPLKTKPASGFRFLTKLRQKNRILRKEIACQSSINFTPHMTPP
jgi:starvation-inducible DNA-binding protein